MRSTASRMTKNKKRLLNFLALDLSSKSHIFPTLEREIAKSRKKEDKSSEPERRMNPKFLKKQHSEPARQAHPHQRMFEHPKRVFDMKANF